MHWRDRLINIHPSLLPAFPGLDTHARALAEGVRLAGCTVHFVRAEMDHGPIIVQAAVPVLAGDDEAKLAARILTAEHRAYPLALRLIGEGRVTVVGERADIAGMPDTGAILLNPVGRTAARDEQRRQARRHRPLLDWHRPYPDLQLGQRPSESGGDVGDARRRAVRAARRQPAGDAAQPALTRGIAIAFWIALALNLLYLAGRIVAPHVIDIATTTLAAGQALLHGQNPYVVSIDRGPESFGFEGYKYYPMMIADYLPLGVPLGQRGVLLTNLIVWLGCLALMRRLAGNRLAPLLLMMLPLVIQQIFAKGATDLATVLPLLGAFALIERGPFWCGLCAGLSLATKPLPGVAVLPALISAARAHRLYRRRRRWAAADRAVLAERAAKLPVQRGVFQPGPSARRHGLAARAAAGRRHRGARCMGAGAGRGGDRGVVAPAAAGDAAGGGDHADAWRDPRRARRAP